MTNRVENLAAQLEYLVTGIDPHHRRGEDEERRLKATLI